MSDSILTSTKKILGIEADYTAFDLDIITHVNTVFNTLTQLGVGPKDGFMIEDAEAKWTDFISENVSLNSVKSYVYLRVRLMFDPPTTSYLIDAFKEQIRELEWRLNVAVDTKPLASSIDTDELWVTHGHVFPDEAALGDLGYDPDTGDIWRNEEQPPLSV